MIKTINIISSILIILLVSCGTPSPDVDPGSIEMKLTIDTNKWVHIKSGEFIYGIHNKKSMINNDYEIMSHEVTYQQYSEYLKINNLIDLTLY